MPLFSRTAGSTSTQIVDIGRPFSNFAFLDDTFGVGKLQTLRRIMSQVRQQGGRTMVLEKLDISDAEDLCQENEDIRLRYPSFNKSEAFRLSFFRKPFSTNRGLSTVKPEQFIGYAIVKKDKLPKFWRGLRVYESVIRPGTSDTHFVRGRQRWNLSVDGVPLVVEGYLYCQQNSITNCCAHVAVRTAAARFCGEGDMTYRQINQLTGIAEEGIPPVNHIDRKIGSDESGGGTGLYPDEMVNVLRSVGARVFSVDYSKPPEGGLPLPPFEKVVYGSIESGWPAIVGFESAPDENHAVPVFGHTFDGDTWVPSAEASYFRVGPETEYVPSESWLGTFIAQDDNWGSNYCIPRHFLQTKPLCDKLPGPPRLCEMGSRCVAYVISTLPGGVKLNSIVAELKGVEYLPPLLQYMPAVEGGWGKRLKMFSQAKHLVFRSVLVDGSEYIEHVAKLRDWSGARVQRQLVIALRKWLPSERYWMIELSLPELFQANRRKIAEVLIHAEPETDPDDHFKEEFVLARLPGWLAIPEESPSAEPDFRYIPTAVAGHVELYGCEEGA